MFSEPVASRSKNMGSGLWFLGALWRVFRPDLQDKLAPKSWNNDLRPQSWRLQDSFLKLQGCQEVDMMGRVQTMMKYQGDKKCSF